MTGIVYESYSKKQELIRMNKLFFLGPHDR